MDIQNKANNIDYEVDSRSIIIYGKMGAGKTLLALFISTWSWEKRIYSNTPIYKNGELISKHVGPSNILNIRFSKMPGIIIIDEAGLNFNSRKGMSEANDLFSQVQFLQRKYNVSTVWIGQRIMSIDINARETCDLIVKMKKIRRPPYYPLFLATCERHYGSKIITTGQFKIDIIKYMNIKSYSYNTLEKSTNIKTKENTLKAEG